MSFADRYFRYLVRCDLDGAWDFLGSLEGDELREARAWFQRRQTDLLDKAYADGRSEGSVTEELQLRVSPAWVFSLGPIRLLAPKTAARKVLWRDFWNHQTAGSAFLSQRLCEADRDWVAVFVEEASGLPVGDKGSHLAAILRSAATHHRLPCPTGATFLEHWSAGVPQMEWGRVEGPGRDPVGWLSADPFMPDLLFRHLASGHCGSSEFLPEVLPELVVRGAVDRDAIVEHVLVQLTAPQRPGSQKVLVAILMSPGYAAPSGCCGMPDAFAPTRRPTGPRRGWSTSRGAGSRSR